MLYVRGDVMRKSTILAVAIIFMGLANMVMTYSCFEIQQKQYNSVAFAVSEAINMIDDNMSFEHKDGE